MCNFTTFKSHWAITITLHQSCPQRQLPSDLNNSAYKKARENAGKPSAKQVLIHLLARQPNSGLTIKTKLQSGHRSSTDLR